MNDRNISIALHGGLAAILLASVLLHGCAQDGVEGDDGLPTTNRPAAESACSRLCTIDAAACNGPHQCSLQCSEQLRLLPEDCLLPAETWYTCLASNPAICQHDGTARHLGCDTEGQVFIDCILAL